VTSPASDVNGAPDLPDYAPIPRSALGPALNDQGYYVGRVERNLYWVTDGTYQSAFLTTPDGVVQFDAPPTIGGNLRRAVDEITAAEGVPNTVTHLVYSHHHDDHAGASSLPGAAHDPLRGAHELGHTADVDAVRAGAALPGRGPDPGVDAVTTQHTGPQLGVPAESLVDAGRRGGGAGPAPACEVGPVFRWPQASLRLGQSTLAVPGQPVGRAAALMEPASENGTERVGSVASRVEGLGSGP
jgi:hypothetical protein